MRQNREQGQDKKQGAALGRLVHRLGRWGSLTAKGVGGGGGQEGLQQPLLSLDTAIEGPANLSCNVAALPTGQAVHMKRCADGPTGHQEWLCAHHQLPAATLGSSEDTSPSNGCDGDCVRDLGHPGFQSDASCTSPPFPRLPTPPFCRCPTVAPLW
jgi:hypothetical protein